MIVVNTPITNYIATLPAQFGCLCLPDIQFVKPRVKFIYRLNAYIIPSQDSSKFT